MQPKLVILRGPKASGKSTAFEGLKKKKMMRHWIFLDKTLVKSMFPPCEKRKELVNKSVIALIKLSLTTEKNIIVEEITGGKLSDELADDVKKHQYNMITFQFEVSLENSYKRNKVRRKKRGLIPRSLQELKASIEYHEKTKDPHGIVVDTNTLNPRKTAQFIARQLKK